jgi:hypothetical protein
MNLYLVSRTDVVRYEQYDAFVVAADSEDNAKEIINKEHDPNSNYSDWSHNTETELLGISIATEPEIVLGSFNAG